MNYKAVIFNVDLVTGNPDDADTRETLELLKKNRIRMAMVSSSINTSAVLKNAGLENYFDAVVDGSMLCSTGPHPEMFLKACDVMGTRPVECLVVENSAEWIEAAFRGGFAVAALADLIGIVLPENKER